MPQLSLGLGTYLIAWILACLAAFMLVVSNREHFAFLEAAYWRFLLRPWRLIVFGVALTGMVALAPYSGDPTWDYADSAFMCILTYITAPWAIGVLYRSVRFHPDLKGVYVALCLWLFSASWSYDLYMLLRIGSYPPTWFANLILSSILYWAAGCLWSLTGSATGVTFAFRKPEWFHKESPISYWRLLLYALPFILLAAWLTGMTIWYCVFGT